MTDNEQDGKVRWNDGMKYYFEPFPWLLHGHLLALKPLYWAKYAIFAQVYYARGIRQHLP